MQHDADVDHSAMMGLTKHNYEFAVYRIIVRNCYLLIDDLLNKQQPPQSVVRKNDNFTKC